MTGESQHKQKTEDTTATPTNDSGHQFYRSTEDGYWTTYYVDIGKNWRAYHVHDGEVGDCNAFYGALDWDNLSIKPIDATKLPDEVQRRIKRHVTIENYGNKR